MSGIIRNLLTFLQALFGREQVCADANVHSYYWVTPFDCGVAYLKSDKYLQLVESAQLDYLTKTHLLGRLVRSGVAIVNAAQLIRFSKPIRVFGRVRIETSIAFADDRFAYFLHSVYLKSTRHAQIVVKTKFKRGSISIDPLQLLGIKGSKQPAFIESWNSALLLI